MDPSWFPAKQFINIMKRILVVLSLIGFVGSSAFAGECATACAAKACCKSQTTSVCPVGKANQQAKGAAGSTKERARASKVALQIASR